MVLVQTFMERGSEKGAAMVKGNVTGDRGGEEHGEGGSDGEGYNNARPRMRSHLMMVLFVKRQPEEQWLLVVL